MTLREEIAWQAVLAASLPGTLDPREAFEAGYQRGQADERAAWGVFVQAAMDLARRQMERHGGRRAA